MTKRAFCVGINDYPGEGNDLKGCVNDALAWADLLICNYGFPSSAVKIRTDAQATKSAILDGLQELLEGARAGDILVFTNSSHGTYVANVGEADERVDEAICPYDADTNLIIDDELRALFANLPRGVHLTVISDSCHSGSITRVLLPPGRPTPPPELYRRSRFIRPSALGLPQLTDAQLARIRARQRYPQRRMNELLLSGCQADQSSYDAYIDGDYHGALTYYALQAIENANGHLTYEQLHLVASTLLSTNGYDQTPQLEGKIVNKKREVFS